jgi:hypothetical protein
MLKPRTRKCTYSKVTATASASVGRTGVYRLIASCHAACAWKRHGDHLNHSFVHIIFRSDSLVLMAEPLRNLNLLGTTSDAVEH